MHRYSIDAARAAIALGQLRPSELVRACLAQIRIAEPQVQAWVLVDEAGALLQAQQVERNRDRGDALGPLAGIPLGIKDIFDVAGWPTRAGSQLTSELPAAADAPVVARLRAAGAILLGKTVTTEFACFDPPATRNPWNRSHTPGGSSSGSAAGLAAGMCLGAIGSQTGGSIVRPAAYCGVCGFKPSFQSIDRRGMVPVSTQLDHVGPLAGTVADLQILWQVMADRSASRPAAAAAASASQPFRLGAVELFLEQADSGVSDCVRQAIARLQACGARLCSVRLPEDFADLYARHRAIMAYEAAQYHRATYAAPRPGYGAKLAALLDEGLACSPATYAAALDQQRQARQHFFAAHFRDVDAWIMPATNSTAPGRLDTTGDPRFNSPWSYLGVPEVTLPCGLDADGLPVGLQLVAPAGEDDRLLAIAGWCERQIGFAAQPALVDFPAAGADD